VAAQTRLKTSVTSSPSKSRGFKGPGVCTGWFILFLRPQFPPRRPFANLPEKKSGRWKNDNWLKLPRLMLMYRSATYLVRGFASEVLMGLYTKEELDDGLIGRESAAFFAHFRTEDPKFLCT
jgi:hypothetical protein